MSCGFVRDSKLCMHVSQDWLARYRTMIDMSMKLAFPKVFSAPFDSTEILYAKPQLLNLKKDLL